MKGPRAAQHALMPMGTKQLPTPLDLAVDAVLSSQPQLVGDRRADFSLRLIACPLSLYEQERRAALPLVCERQKKRER